MQASYIPGFPVSRSVYEGLWRGMREDAQDEAPELLYGARARRLREAFSPGVELTANEASIQQGAERLSRECTEAVTRCGTVDAALIALADVCDRWDVDAPECAVTGGAGEIIARACDVAYWRRQLRKVVARRVEHAAIVAGLVGKGRQPYISDESAIRQANRNRANRKAMENVKLRNENGDEFSMAALADKGTGNKKKRRNELMTRIRGFEEVAQLLNHAALFWTITCPSKFHSVGGTNPKYNGATPRQAQRYLCDVWARIRAQLAREGIRPYGFRVVEPHTDGCPHWHMLFFVERKDVSRMAEIVYAYAMQEDGDEAGAKENRVKLVTIQHGNGGSAAAYIAKYISKNIDGEGVGEHKAFENGEEFNVKGADFGGVVITPSMRVGYWSQVWGIRQFQQIAGVPVGIWREFRRIKESTVEGAPEVVRQAWQAAQAVKSENPEEATQADFAAFMQALGGPRTGRDTLIKLYKEKVVVDGKYARYEAEKPLGVYAVEEQEVIYKSVRYVWVRVGEKLPVATGVPVFGGTRTGVNNCTLVDQGEIGLRMWFATRALADEVKNKNFGPSAVVDWGGIQKAGREVEEKTDRYAAALNLAWEKANPGKAQRRAMFLSGRGK